MTSVDMLEAGTRLSRLVEAIEQGKEREIVIVRDGRPVARLVPVRSAPLERGIGVASGEFEAPNDIDRYNEEVARLFYGDQQ